MGALRPPYLSTLFISIVTRPRNEYYVTESLEWGRSGQDDAAACDDQYDDAATAIGGQPSRRRTLRRRPFRPVGR
ncbi:hypothetical protein Trydic_g5680 [Trypoxylus dichotomus]